MICFVHNLSGAPDFLLSNGGGMLEAALPMMLCHMRMHCKRHAPPPHCLLAPSSTFTGCSFSNNTAATQGGAMQVGTMDAAHTLSITACNFTWV